MESAVYNNSNTTVLCDKENITLVKHDENKYTISLDSVNKNINFRNIINFKLYTIMGTVNSKHIKSAEMIQQISDNEATFLFLFNALGADFGIPKKYMYLKTTSNILSDNVIQYTSKSIDVDNNVKSKIKRYEKITCVESTLTITLHSNTNIHIDYYFNIDVHEELPMFARNLIGFIMKKIFLNLKSFIENIKL
jgi:hypothetical protein